MNFNFGDHDNLYQIIGDIYQEFGSNKSYFRLNWPAIHIF